MSFDSLKKALDEWAELNKEYELLERTHETYCKEIENVKKIQAQCVSGVNHQRYRMKQILQDLKPYPTNKEDLECLNNLKKLMDERRACCRELEENLPHKNGLYLTIILGSVNVSLLSKQDKFIYKDDYERFKLFVNIISFFLGIIIILCPYYRVADALIQFLAVWYYCTLTIRESILKVNGSRIKGWWLTHHFISTVCSGIILIWPDGFTYQEFRGQYLLFCTYLCLISIGQFYYQRGMIYRLRALGEKHNMDITVDGFQSWMWKGLTFILPFLISGYIFQLYNSYTLFYLATDKKCVEWQVLVLSAFFFILFFGNSWTMFLVIRQKIKKEGWRKNFHFFVVNKYRFTDNIKKNF